MLSKEDRELSRAVAESIWGSQQWCVRKVESIELLEGERARRRVSLDCTPPPDPALAYVESERTRRRGPRSQSMVPVGLIRKGAVRNLDTADLGGEPVSVLSARENGALAAAALGYQFERECSEITPPIRELLTTIVYADPATGAQAVERLVGVAPVELSPQFIDLVARI